MEHSETSAIVRQQIAEPLGIQSIHYHRNTIGYVEQGTKLIHQADRHLTVQAGELFHLPAGIHHIEEVPTSAREPFRQTLFFYSSSDLHPSLAPVEALARAGKNCSTCHNTNGVYTYPAWPVMQRFFENTHAHLDTGSYPDNPALAQLKLHELIHLLAAHPSCCLSLPLAERFAGEKNSLSQIVQQHALTTSGANHLAELCGMPPSRFKLEFRRHFHATPHQWLIEQRLSHARLRLISSHAPVLEIALGSGFTNASHFIKLFRRRFGKTPLVYRREFASGTPEVEN